MTRRSFANCRYPVDKKRIMRRMGNLLRVVRRIGLIWLATLSLAIVVQAQTAEQLRQLENLTPAQRAAILKALDVEQQSSEPPLESPQVVSPRTVNQEPYESTATEAGRGISGIRGLETPTESEQPLAELKPFGYDLFAGEPTTFAPATDIPIPVDYVIGPGDTIEVQLFGSENAQYNLVVTREGVLNFPEIGPISVVGLTFSDLRQSLQQRVSEQMLGVSASISMGTLRSIRVFLLGDVYRPGSYTVSSLSTTTNALFVGGGINEIGSLRNVQLRRNGNLVSRLDLYDLLLRGDTSGDARLQPGDVIFVPPVGMQVGVDGDVRRPAIYELKTENQVADVVELAGGVLATAYPKASQIERINADRERTVIDVDLTSTTGLSTPVKANDTIRIYSVEEKREDIVFLAGHVVRSGAFQWQAGMRLTDLISSPTELLPQADLHYALIRRELPDTLQVRILSADLAAAFAAPGSDADVLLSPRDQVTLFDQGRNRGELVAPIIEELRVQSSIAEPSREVAIAGRVRAPGLYPMVEGMRISDLLRAGGRLDEAAYSLEAELTRFSTHNGQPRQTELVTVDLSRVLQGDPAADIELLPHDVLTIKEVPLWREIERVEIVGEVQFPGQFPIRRGERLSSVLRRAGGTTDLAFPEGAIFLRESLRIREQQQLEELAERLESDVESIGVAAEEPAEITSARRALLDQTKRTEATGRLVIDLPAVLSGLADDDVDIMLRDGDRILIPKQSQTVTIIGEVQFPTSHIFSPDNYVQDYIAKSGGITVNADKKRIYVVRADGAVEPSGRSRFFRNRNGQLLRPGDTIVVPLDADRISKLSLWTNVTTIIYNIGVAAAAVSSFL